MHRILSFAATVLGIFAAAIAHANVDRSPKPGGVYKLKPGLFVAKEMPCESPPNLAIRRYDGKGISTAHSRSCTVRILSKRRSGYGNRYKVSQTCLDAGSGPAKPFTIHQTVDIPDALTFRSSRKVLPPIVTARSIGSLPNSARLSHIDEVH